MNGDISRRLFNTIADIIKNQGGAVEAAKGLIWRSLTMAHQHFIEDLDCSTVGYELDLFPDRSVYPLDNFVMKITDYWAAREDLEITFELTKVSPADARSIKITCGQTNIVSGDVLNLICEIAVPDDFELSETQDPTIEKRYHRLLEDYAAACYAGLNTSEGDKLRLSESKKAIVDTAVEKKQAQTHALNRARTGNIKQLYWGN